MSEQGFKALVGGEDKVRGQELGRHANQPRRRPWTETEQLSRAFQAYQSTTASSTGSAESARLGPGGGLLASSTRALL